MRLLLDTHALLWLATDSDRFNPATLQAIYKVDEVLVSPISAYELTFKHALGKLPVATRLLADLPVDLKQQRFDLLPVSLAHAEVAGRLATEHRYPFDRLVAAQALVDNLTLISIDAGLDVFAIKRLW